MEDTIEVVSSEENGNVPVEEILPIAPSEQPETPAPEETQKETGQPPVTEPELFELPDGRKVDGATVAQEYKNILSDYTRKSQTLAEIERNKATNTTPEKPFQDPNWQPNSWEEAIKIAKAEALEEIETRARAQAEQKQAIEDAVVAQLTEIKTIDPNLNENALFSHAHKYGFRDLKLAHKNMKDMAETIKKVQTTTVQNMTKRNDPVSATPNANGSRPNPSAFGSAIEYLRSLK